MGSVGGPANQPTNRFFEFSLLLLVVTGFAAVVFTGRLDRGTTLAAGAALIARALIIAGWFRLPLSETVVRVLTIAYIGFYPLDYRYLSGSLLGATVRLVFFLAAVKLLTAKTGRDYLYLAVIGFLELLSAAMLTTSAGILAFLVLFLVFAVAARTSYEIQSNFQTATHRVARGNTVWKLASLSAAMALVIAAIGLGIFFIVPRAAGAYLSRLPATGESFLGYSNEVVLGTSGRLLKDPTPLLRVKILEGRPRAALKWRGGALTHFDGVRWSNPRPSSQRVDVSLGQYFLPTMAQRMRRQWLADPGEGSGLEMVQYRVTRVPMNTDALFLPGIPEMVEGDFSRLELSDTGAIAVPGSRWKALQYRGSSLLTSARPRELRGWEGAYASYLRSLYLQLPELDPRIPKLARYITENQITPYWRAAALEHYLRTEFGYTLELPAEPPPDPLADFLFRRKKGHCEYFASAMAVMLRSIGIPARLANGFQSGVYNPFSGYYTVRASDAHVWVEAYFPGYDWVTFDPTPPDQQPGSALGRSWLYLDALETFWNDWIVEYDRSRQTTLARAFESRWYDFGFETIARWERGWRRAEGQWRSWNRDPSKALGSAAVALGAGVGIALLAWTWPRMRGLFAALRARRGRARIEDCAILYTRALHELQRRGLTRESWETAQEFARRIHAPQCPPARVALFQQITTTYNRARFGRDREATQHLAALIQQWNSR